VFAGVFLLVIAVYHFARLAARDRPDRGARGCSRTVGLPRRARVGAAAWRGLLSRPAWRILVYSADEPPSIRGLVELDAVDGHVIGEYTERNPEDWSEYGLSS
jgi:hypothetical protein